jgi:cell division protein FtsB
MIPADSIIEYLFGQSHQMEEEVVQSQISDNATAALNQAKEKFRTLWMRRAELEQQLDLEKDLREILSTESFSCQTRNFPEITQNQIKELIKNPDDSLLNQIETLSRIARELERKAGISGSESIESKESLQHEIDQLRVEIRELGAEIDDLVSQISGFDDEEIHLLRAERQHIELTRRKLSMGGNLK